MKIGVSEKASRFTESVIREMTRLAIRHDGVNLAQGFPDFAAPLEIKEAACKAIQDDINQYAITWGAPSFRRALAEKMRRFYGMEIDPTFCRVAIARWEAFSGERAEKVTN